MTKEKYIKMRNSKKYDLKWFYDYFLENKGSSIDINLFGQLFNMGDLNNVLSSLDSTFQLTKLEDSNGQFIKIII